MPKPIAFIDLAAQRDAIRDRLDQAIGRVVDHVGFIMGPEVAELERRLCDFGGMRRTVSCASGMDALLLPLMAWNIGPGDAVFCPSFTFAATAEAPAVLGATPVFVDVDEETFNIDPASLERAVEAIRAEKRLVPRAVIAVDLFGQPAAYPALRALCDRFGLKLISDAAQGFGGTLGGEKSGRWADVVATSFFPAKPLGGYGDGGAVQTNDAELAETMESIRIHGKGDTNYDHVRLGLTARLDTLQAAILIEKLEIFPAELEARARVAARYDAALGDVVTVPRLAPGAFSTWAQYTVKVPSGLRAGFAADLKAAGIPTAIYYARPLHRQPAYRCAPVEGGALPATDRLADAVISLPMHPYLDEETQDRIVAAVRSALAARAARAA